MKEGDDNESDNLSCNRVQLEDKFNEVDEGKEVSEMELNNKDDLFWVENEVVVIQDTAKDEFPDVSFKGSREKHGSDEKKFDEVPESNNSSGVVDVDKSGENISPESDATGTGVENKLWKYFTQHNSSQLKCNLCLGVFLYQSNASHLLSHIEVAHNIPVGVPVKSTPMAQPSKRNITSNKDYSGSSSTASQLTVNEDKFSTEENTKLRKYFTKLDSGKFRCNLCCRILYNLQEVAVVRHFKSYHSDVYRTVVSTGSCQTENTDATNDCAKKFDLFNAVFECFMMLPSPDRIKCKLCQAVLKFSEDDNRNLQRHLIKKHSDCLIDSDVSKRHTRLGHSDQQRFVDEDSSTVVLEVIDDGDNNYVANTESSIVNDTSLTELTNSPVVIKLESVGDDDNDLQIERTWSITENVHTYYNIKSNEDGTVTEIIERNKIWNFFTKSDSSQKVKCKLCAQLLSCVKSPTLKLSRHLAEVHGIMVCNQQRRPDENLEDEHQLHDLTPSNESNLSSIVSADNKSENRKLKKPKDNKINNLLRKHFSKLYRGKVICNFCEKPFSYRLGQISNLVKHLRTQHRIMCSRNKLLRNKGTVQRAKQVNTKDIVWKYFTVLDETKAQCDLCEHVNVLFYSKSSLSNLLKHLKHKHRYFLDVIHYNQTEMIQDENAFQHDHDNNVPGIDMNSLYQYFITEANLGDFIKYEKEQIVCRFCTGMFLCDDLINFESTIKCHVQTCHAGLMTNQDDSFSLENDVTSVHDESMEPSESDVSNSDYNELEAISSEISSYKN